MQKKKFYLRISNSGLDRIFLLTRNDAGGRDSILKTSGINFRFRKGVINHNRENECFNLY